MANDFLPFGTGAGSNVLSQSAYAALAARSAGFVAGLADAQPANKAWRQSSIMSSMIAQFITDILGVDVIDDGTIATIENNFELAIRRLLYNSWYAVDTGGVNALLVALTPAPLSYVAGMVIYVKIGHTNTGPGTINANGLGIRSVVSGLGAPLIGGQLVLNEVVPLIYDGSSFQLVSGSPSVGGVLTGSLPNPGLANSGAVAGTYVHPQVTVGVDGRVTGIASSAGVGGVLTGSLPNPGFAANPVFSGALVTSGGITSGGTINSTGNIIANGGRLRAALGAASGDVNAATILADFPSSLGGNGYKKYPDVSSPSGYYIEQWGEVLVAGASNIVFPVAFPSACLSCLVCEGNASSGTWGSGFPTLYGVGSRFPSYAVAWGLIWTTGSTWVGGSTDCMWVAKGY